MTAQDAFDLGIVTKLVEPAAIDSAIKDLCAGGKPQKYGTVNIPEKFKPYEVAFGQANIPSLFAGDPADGVSKDMVIKLAKMVGFKAPLALKIGNEIIDQQAGKSIEEAVEIELDRLNEIFSTADALEGLSSLGRKRPEFKGA